MTTSGHMTSVKIADLKSHLSEHLRAVERGDSIEVTDRARPIARIVPIEGDDLVITRATVPFEQVRGAKLKPVRWPLISLDVLTDDRRRR